MADNPASGLAFPSMRIRSHQLKRAARDALSKPDLQTALQRLQGNFVRGRAERVAEMEDYEALREAAAAIRDRALASLDLWLEAFERNATARGAVVHWAATREDVN